jgi:hypothetical protein
MEDNLWKHILKGQKQVKELGAQLIQMQIENAKPSEKLQIVDNFLRKAEQKQPTTTALHKAPAASSKAACRAETPPMTPNASSSSSSSKATCCKTPGTHHAASRASKLTEFSDAPPRVVCVSSPIKKTKDLGVGLCSTRKLCAVPFLALERRCFSPCGNGKPNHTCNECKGIIHSGLCATE